ncbi:WD repeat-containing protein 34 isoform X2 [Stegostoma tigrinum]|uniref:WD repeat-containing protein 34 isoform X2 n=1 Tax=Stegostoma tigrinum TaxID=3053191 RepID=UPI00202B410C|nr:WD repeat-containing protein 34 isoform X2 [Stegostoma tigrinum]
MFTDEVREAVSIDSRWRKVPELRDAVCQTAVVRRTEASVQIRRNARSGTQTDPVECRDLPAFDGSVEPSIDSPRLARFLRQVEPMVSKELMKNIKSHAFDGFEVNWIDHPNTVSCLHTLHYPEAQKRKLHVTGVSWNVTGSVIACAYGRLEDGDWSTEKSYVCSWNLDRRGLNPERPNTVIDVSSAVMCLAFHPVEPSLIAVFLFPKQVHWIQSLSRSNRINVLSASTDGKILIWQMDGRGRLVLQDGFALIVQQMPRNVKLHKVSEDSLFGVTSLSFSRLDKTVFIAGVEGGYVLKCSTEVLTHAALSSGSVPLKAPAQFTFSPHCGPVHAVDCSPFHRNLFLTAGTDGHVHLYSMLQAEPILSLQLCQSYLFSVNWSFVRPLVFAAATGEGTVLIFDLGHSSLRPTVSIEQNTERKPVYCLAFNPKRPELLAAGNAEGSVKIWQLSAELTKEGSREISLLEQFANEAVD